jgi:type IV secretory pathway VirB2 component (pilin)
MNTLANILAGGLHISTGTLEVIALVIFIVIGLFWLFGRLR